MTNLFTLIACLLCAGLVKSIDQKSVTSGFCFSEEETVTSVCESLNKKGLSRNDKESILQNKDEIDVMKEQLTEIKKQMEDLKQEARQVCRTPFSHVGNSCMFPGKEEMNYDNAVSYCHGYGAYLVTPSTHQTFQILTNFLVAAYRAANPGLNRSSSPYYWVSATDREEEGTWKWYDGVTLDSNDTVYWYDGQPNQEDPNVDCAYMVLSGTWKLHDCECEITQLPLCQYNLQ